MGKTSRIIWTSGEDFPVIISLVGPEDDLSIQVHPDDGTCSKNWL